MEQNIKANIQMKVANETGKSPQFLVYIVEP